MHDSYRDGSVIPGAIIFLAMGGVFWWLYDSIIAFTIFAAPVGLLAAGWLLVELLGLVLRACGRSPPP